MARRHRGDVRASRRAPTARAGHADGGTIAVEDLKYKMIMALNAADLGNPICEQAAEICAEIADQHCAQLHVTTAAPVIAVAGAAISTDEGA